MEKKVEKVRESNLELFRILTMVLIIAHHYVVNSGLLDIVLENATLSFKDIVILIFGWGGKTGINCFVLISGYFMCKSTITWKKFLKLILEVEFYRVLIYCIFLFSGYQPFSIVEFVKAVLPVYNIGSGFTNSYLAFYLFIPFLNILIQGMTEKQHLALVALCLTVYTIFSTFLFASPNFSYVGWFMVLYLIAAFVRLYPKSLFGNTKIWGWASLCTILISWCSVIVGAYIGKFIARNTAYYFVSDSNKILAVVVGFCTFMFFLNVKVPYNKIINKFAASTFGVLLIHANSETMRRWLWRDVLNNVGWYETNWAYLHMIISVVVVYAVCTLLDMLRIRLVEKPFFAYLEKVPEKNK